MKDVARECGLSLATVSKVINGLPVGKNSRRLVEEAIEKLGYRVNPYARALKSNKTNNIALVMPSLKHPFFAHLTDELIDCLEREGFNCMLMITHFDTEAERRCFDLVRSNKTDGVIALTYSPDIEVSGDIPIVTIDRHLGERIPCVSSDNYRGGELAAEKLIGLGCRRLLFMRTSSHIPGEPDKRFVGFDSYCELKGIEMHPILLHDEDTEEPFYRYLDEHIADGEPDFDGVFCNTDGLALRVIDHLRSRGVEVPAQVQVIGYDGIPNRATGRYMCSTIEQPLSQMAQVAVTLIMNYVETTEGMNVTLPVKYIPGGTTRD